MKKVISLTMVLLILFSLCSCKQKSDDEPAMTHSNEDTSPSHSDEFLSEQENGKEETADNTAEIKPDTEDTTNGAENTQNDKTEENVSYDSQQSNIDTTEETAKPYASLKLLYKESEYVKMYIPSIALKGSDRDKSLLDNLSVYNVVDLNTLDEAEESAVVEYYCRSETDGLELLKEESVQLLTLPEAMQKDADIDFIAVRNSEGENELFYKLKSFEGKTVGEYSSALQRLYGEDYTSDSAVNKITVYRLDEKYEINDTQSINEIRNEINTFVYTADTEDVIEISDRNRYQIILEYKDENIMRNVYNFDREKLLIDNTVTAGQNFEELLQSFMTEENLVKE